MTVRDLGFAMPGAVAYRSLSVLPFGGRPRDWNRPCDMSLYLESAIEGSDTWRRLGDGQYRRSGILSRIRPVPRPEGRAMTTRR